MLTIKTRLTAALLCTASVIATAHAKSADLPGSEQNIPDSVRESQSIFVGRFLSFGSPTMGPTAMTRFLNAQVAVEKSLLNGPEGTVNATFLVRTVPPEKRESMPELGQAYVFFAIGSNNVQFRKVAPATPEVINEVQRLVGALPNARVSTEEAQRNQPQSNVQPASTPLLHEALLPASPSAAAIETATLGPASSSPTTTPLAERSMHPGRKVTTAWFWMAGLLLLLIVGAFLLKRRR